MKKPKHNSVHLKPFRRQLRKRLTSAEATLWNSLKGKGLAGRKFRRQHSIDNYIVDFYCASEKVVVELDGTSHLEFSQSIHDDERNAILEHMGFAVLRFENKMVFEDLEGVLQIIYSHFKVSE